MVSRFFRYLGYRTVGAAANEVEAEIGAAVGADEAGAVGATGSGAEG